MRKSAIAAAVLACVAASPALAAPGLAGEIYGAQVEQGEFEIEAIWGALDGGADDGENAVRIEASYGVSEHLRIGVQAEFEREPGERRKAEELGIEAIYELGSAGGIEFALYGEYAFGLNGNADKVETKLLLQHARGPFDLRLNLIAEKELEHGHKVELEYSASAMVEAFGEISIGAQAYGELGTFDKLLPRARHFAGPVAKVEIEGLGPELEIEAGYLFALGAAREETDGQFRLALDIEF